MKRVFSLTLLAFGWIAFTVCIMTGLTHGHEQEAWRYEFIGIGLITVAAIVANIRPEAE